MRSASRAALFAWGVVGLVGCAAISGLDQISENACAPDCGAASDDATSSGSDGDVDSRPGLIDSWQPSDATIDSGEDSSAGRDSTTDSSAHADGAAVEDSAAPRDAMETDATDANDAPSGSDASDASGETSSDAANDGAAEAETGCGPTNTLSNCGACGSSCATAPSSSIATATCNGTSCTYSCQAGYLDCNASTGTNSDGCECATPNSISATCCGSACPHEHVTGFAMGQTGLNQTFYDCESTMDQQVALDACKAYAGQADYCAAFICTTPDGGAGDSVVCNASQTSPELCVCWDYSGTAAGHTYSSGSFNCKCPLPGDPSYH